MRVEPTKREDVAHEAARHASADGSDAAGGVVPASADWQDRTQRSELARRQDVARLGRYHAQAAALLALQQRAGNHVVARMVEGAIAGQRRVQRGLGDDFKEQMEDRAAAQRRARKRKRLPGSARLAYPRGSLPDPARPGDKKGELRLTTRPTSKPHTGNATGAKGSGGVPSDSPSPESPPTAEGVNLGSLSYNVGPLDELYLPGVLHPSPQARPRNKWLEVVEALFEQSVPVVRIGGFDSSQRTTKGIGSALLRGLLEIADGHDCDYIFVEAGINPEVYTALGFELIDPQGPTWMIKRSALRARVREPRWDKRRIPSNRAHESPPSHRPWRGPPEWPRPSGFDTSSPATSPDR